MHVHTNEMNSGTPVVNIPLTFLNDRRLESQVKVTKVDAETGKVVAVEGTTFKIFDKTTNKFIQDYVPNTQEMTK
ncbi:MAG: hypothetical protein LBV67_12535 [Streptococcaceae bacterium]|nr:hypothetical protein [Streptococcaceae bacterium]